MNDSYLTYIGFEIVYSCILLTKNWIDYNSLANYAYLMIYRTYVEIIISFDLGVFTIKTVVMKDLVLRAVMVEEDD